VTRAGLALALAAILLPGQSAGAATVRPAPGAVTEGSRYRCPDIAEAAPATAFFDRAVYQGDDGWFFRMDSDVTDFTMQAPQVLAMVARLSEALEQRGVGLVYLPIPTRAMTDADRLPEGIDDGLVYDGDLASDQFKALVSRLRASGVTTVDLLSTVEAGASTDGSADDGQDFHFARDTHWRPEGARIAARTAATTIEAAGLLRGVPRVSFASTAAGEQPLVSPMARALQDLCLDPLDPNTYAVWETARTEVTADDLLGGGGEDGAGEAAPIAVVGTSYSDIPAFNFIGFLSEATGVDVANYAISGGGTYTALLQWSHSPAVDGPLPKVLVWENPVAYRLDAGGVAALRQIIPAVKGGCDGSAAFSGTVRVEPGRAATVAIPQAVSASGHDAWLSVRLGDPTLRSFRMTLEARDGDREDFAISRPPRMGDTDRAFLELSDDVTAPLGAVTIAAPVTRPTDFTLDLCQPKGA
jgi:alginate biosynthesis protein AlgX